MAGSLSKSQLQGIVVGKVYVFEFGYLSQVWELTVLKYGRAV